MNRPKFYDVIAANRHYPVSQEQVNRCLRVLSMDSGEVYYRVRSMTKAATEYEVRYNRILRRFTCTCANGIAPTCWHRRAATVAEREYQKARQAEYEERKRRGKHL